MGTEIIKSETKFEEIINDLEKSIIRIENIFNNEVNNTNKIDGNNDTWMGVTQEVTYDKLLQVQKNYNPILESLDNYTKFLRMTLQNYMEFENNISRNEEKNEVELEVNN